MHEPEHEAWDQVICACGFSREPLSAAVVRCVLVLYEILCSFGQRTRGGLGSCRFSVSCIGGSEWSKLKAPGQTGRRHERETG